MYVCMYVFMYGWSLSGVDRGDSEYRQTPVSAVYSGLKKMCKIKEMISS